VCIALYSLELAIFSSFSISELDSLGDILEGDIDPESRPFGGEPANGLLLFVEIFLFEGIGLLLPELDFLPVEEMPFKLNSISFL